MDFSCEYTGNGYQSLVKNSSNINAFFGLIFTWNFLIYSISSEMTRSGG